MRVSGSSVIPLRFHPEDKVRNIGARVVEGLLYRLILGASCFRRHKGVLSFTEEVGFRPLPKAPWVPFANSAPGAQPGGGDRAVESPTEKN